MQCARRFFATLRMTREKNLFFTDGVAAGEKYHLGSFYGIGVGDDG